MADIDEQRAWAKQHAHQPYVPPVAAPSQPQWAAPGQPGAAPPPPQPWGTHPSPTQRTGAYRQARAEVMRQLVIGLAFLGVGLAVTVGGYVWAGQRSAESGQSSSYLVLYGPVIFGVIRTGKALLGLASLRDERI